MVIFLLRLLVAIDIYYFAPNKVGFRWPKMWYPMGKNNSSEFSGARSDHLKSPQLFSHPAPPNFGYRKTKLYGMY